MKGFLFPSEIGLIKQQIKEAKQTFKEKEGRPPELTIGILKMGGHGDFLQQLVFARAVRRKWGARRALLVLFSRALSPTMAEVQGQKYADHVNIALLDAAIGPMQLDNVLHMPLTVSNWRRLVHSLCNSVDCLWDVQYVAKAYWRDLDKHAREQLESDKYLALYSRYYSGFPLLSNPELHWLRMTQWELLADSTGLDVREDDLRLEAPDLGDDMSDLKPYVTLHNGAGGKAMLKCLPPACMDSISVWLKGQGITPVQLGIKDDSREPPITGATDYRGVPVAISLALLKNASLHVDIEGGLVYMAKGVGCPRCVFFGPTSPHVFKFHDNVTDAYRCRKDSLGEPACQPCWWWKDTWDRRCPKGLPWCHNLPHKEEAVESVKKALEHMGVLKGPEDEDQCGMRPVSAS